MLDLCSRPARKALRGYQVKALDMLRAAMGVGKRCVVLLLPTGAGKTLIAAHIILCALDKGRRVLFIVPAISLVDQTIAALEELSITDIGVTQGLHSRTNPLARVQVATAQTLARRRIPAADLVIVDEVHLRSQVVEDLMSARPDLYFVGLSATPWAKGMGLIWEGLIVPITIRDLIDTGFLSRFSVFAPDIPDLSGVAIRAGDYDERRLAKVMGHAILVGSVVEFWLANGGDRPTLLFAVNRAQVRARLAGRHRRHPALHAGRGARSRRRTRYNAPNLSET